MFVFWLQIFLWTGPGANRQEKAKGVQMAHTLDDERGGRPEIILLSEVGDKG